MVKVRWRHRHTPYVTRRLFNSDNFATSAALAEVCASLSAIPLETIRIYVT